MAENYRPVSLDSVISAVFENLVKNRLLDHLKKISLFSDFQYGFRCTRLTADILKVAADTVISAFKLGVLKLWNLIYLRF